MELITKKDRQTGCQFFLAGEKGVLLDFTNKENLMLSIVRYLGDNATALEEKDNAYYIDNYKYLNKAEFRKYLDEIATELGNEVIKEKTYLCSKHRGKYFDIKKTYKKILDEIKSKNYEIIGIPIEQYIDSSYDKINGEWVINVMIPIRINEK